MTITTKYNVGDKVYVIIKCENSENFKIEKRKITEYKLINGTSPFIVYKLGNNEKTYYESELFNTRQNLENALVRQVRRIVKHTGELYPGVFLEIHDITENNEEI